MNGAIDQAVRQSGAIFLKNFCVHFWPEREVNAAGDAGPAFVIDKQDKKVIYKKKSCNLLILIFNIDLNQKFNITFHISFMNHKFEYRLKFCCLVHSREHRGVDYCVERAPSKPTRRHCQQYHQTRLSAQFSRSER